MSCLFGITTTTTTTGKGERDSIGSEFNEREFRERCKKNCKKKLRTKHNGKQRGFAIVV